MANDFANLPETKPESWAEVVYLIEAAENIGGRRLPDAHDPERVHYKNPPAATDKLAYRDVPELRPLTCGCKLAARVAVPYERENGTAGFVMVCLVCDAGHRMPVLVDAGA